jgi:hypothetical protein
VALVDDVRRGRDDVAAGERALDARDADRGAGPQPWIAFGDAPEHDLARRPGVQLRLGDALGVLVVAGHLSRERELTAAADGVRRHLGRDVAAEPRARDASLVQLDAQRVPAADRDGAAGGVSVQLDPGLVHRLAERERQLVPDSLERDQVQRVVADRRVQPAALRDLDEQLEIGLAVLDQVAVARTLHDGVHLQPRVRRQLPGELGDARLHVRAQLLRLSQPVRRVVAADAYLTPVRGAVDVLDPRDVAREERLLGAHDDDAQLLAGSRQRGIAIAGAGEDELADRRHVQLLLHADLGEHARRIVAERLSVDLDVDTRDGRHAGHRARASAASAGMRSSVPGAIRVGSPMPLNFAISRQAAGSP